jgi:hypothetical protein
VIPRDHNAAVVFAGYLLVALMAISLAGCNKDDDNGSPLDPDDGLDSAVEYTERGWERFEAANFSQALSDFNSAVFLDASYGEAYLGQGWSRLAKANSVNSMRGSVGPFTSAILYGEDGAATLAGRAAAYLGSGTNFLDAAVADAQSALADDDAFVFTHRPSFTVQDIHLIEAFAKASQGDFPGALAAADLVLDSGIKEDDQETWRVDGTIFESYLGAVLAHLQKVSEQFSG